MRKRVAGIGFGSERGALSLEAVVLLPALLLVLMLVIAFGRISSSGNTVDTAARNAARAASLERSAESARSAGESVAFDILHNHGMLCTSMSVSISTGGFAVPVGQPASATATVTCTVPLSDIGLPGLPGTKTLTSTFTSPIDSYRQRG
ncbi:TadE/TadG family type IV pilus assembly protein [Streptomyces xiamenensis]|uniref:TadE/TadG family type IV pilus assembly protein n=1 Tax=Streptomyces xiamenensis TaxID=408015 RepID=UPI0036EA5FAF